MAKQLQLRRGTTIQHAAFTGVVGEVTVDIDKDTLVVHDGVAAGGFPVASEALLGTHTSDTANPHSVTKSQVGLSNVDNTSDANKPISSATQNALNLKVDKDPTTGAVYIGSYLTINRPTFGANDRAIGYNLDLTSFEGWDGTTWGSIGGGATGGGADQVFVNTEYTINNSYLIPAGKSSVIVSDSSNNVYFAAGVQIDFSTGSKVVVL